MIRWWHQHILGHEMEGPVEIDDHRVWRDHICRRDFRSVILRPNLDAPPL